MNALSHIYECDSELVHQEIVIIPPKKKYGVTATKPKKKAYGHVYE